MPADPLLKQRVLSRIAVMEDSDKGLLSSFFGTLSWKGFLALSAACSAVFMLSAAILVHERRVADELMLVQSQHYFLAINPSAHAEGSAMDDAAEPSLIDMLAWMRSSLNLSRAQFQALVQLHSDYEDRFVSLYKDLCDIKAQYQGYEKKRLNDDVIDFMQLYDLLRERDALREYSEQTSQQFIALVLEVLTPEQARGYLALLNRSNYLLPTSELPAGNAGQRTS